MKRVLLVSLILLVLAIGPKTLAAEWETVLSDSSLHFVSVKNDAIGETHQFDSFFGSFNDTDGSFGLIVDLASVNTGIDIRDSRLMRYLFDVEKSADARISGQIDPVVVRNLAVGASVTLELKANMNFKGILQPVQAQVSVVRVSETKMLVSTISPVLITADQFDLNEGVGNLRDLVQLSSIDRVFPITFRLTLEQ